MNDDLNLNLQKAEGEVAVLHELADFMVQKKFPKAKEHTDEVVSLETEIMECWPHKRAVTGAARAAPPPKNRPNQDGVGNMKLIGELKPDNLTHDSSAGDLSVWRKKFESYYAASNLQFCKLCVQQAHLLNCLDRELSLQLDSSIQATTPVLGAGVTCLSILTGIFEKKYPLLLRRKNYFSMTQQNGQDERSFAEAVKLATNEADIAALTLQDSLCLVIITGWKDARLREKMSELEESTIAAFKTLIDAHVHSKATANAASSARTNSQPSRGRGNNGRNNQSGQAEKKRRQIMKGKCFRWTNADHFANNCSLAKDIKCKRCNNTGHIVAACAQPGAKANATSEQEHGQECENPVLQLEYRPAAQDKYAESRAVGSTQYAPVQPVPFPTNVQHPS